MLKKPKLRLIAARIMDLNVVFKFRYEVICYRFYLYLLPLSSNSAKRRFLTQK